MAATPFKVYNQAKKYLMDGTLDIDNVPWRMALFTSASNAPSVTLSAYNQITGEVAEGNGYSSSGKALPGVSWGIGASAGEMKFTCSPFFWSANAGDIVNAKHAVIFDPVSGKTLCTSQLSGAQFTVTAGNRLTITPAATGIFYLRG